MASSDYDIPRPESIDDPAELFKTWSELRADVLALLESVPAESFQVRPGDGSWSMSEVAEHLYLTQLFFARALPVVLRGKLGVAMEETQSRLEEEVINKVAKPQGVKNPEPVTPSGEWAKGDHIEPLDQAMSRLSKGLKGKAKSDLKARGMVHGIFGEIDLFHYLWVLTKHEQAHLEAMEKKLPALTN